MDTKSSLRTRLRAERRGRYVGPEGAVLRAREAQQILQHAVERIPAGPVTVYQPLAVEPDVMPLARALHERGHDLLFPSAADQGDGALDWILWDGSDGPAPAAVPRGFGADVHGRRRGRSAIADAAVVLAPALAVDRSGTRLGQGGGYYDRALALRDPEATVVALVHPHEVLAAGELPRERFDESVDVILTAGGWEPLTGRT